MKVIIRFMQRKDLILNIIPSEHTINFIKKQVREK